MSRTERISPSFTREEKAKIQIAAMMRGMKMSELLRTLALEYVEETEINQDMLDEMLEGSDDEGNRSSAPQVAD